MKIIVEGYGDMTADVAAELALLRIEEQNRVVREAAAQQARIARAGNEARHLPCGFLSAQIDEDVFNYWERREGRGFWADKSNLRYMKKRHPEIAVRSRAGKTTIRVEQKLPRAGAAARPLPAGTILDARGRAAA